MRELPDEMTFVPRSSASELTLRCNLRCGHGGSSAGNVQPADACGVPIYDLAPEPPEGDGAASDAKRVALGLTASAPSSA